MLAKKVETLNLEKHLFPSSALATNAITFKAMSQFPIIITDLHNEGLVNSEFIDT
jgi:hypothetical protein